MNFDNMPIWLKWMFGILGPAIILAIGAFLWSQLSTPFKTMKTMNDEDIVARIELLEQLPQPKDMEEYIEKIEKLDDWQDEMFDEVYLVTINGNSSTIKRIQEEELKEIKKALGEINSKVGNLSTLDQKLDLVIELMRK